LKYTSTHNKKTSYDECNEMVKKFDLHDVPEFSMRFRGYDKYETDKYLSALLDAYVQLFEENLEMELELNQYRQTKTAISDALVTAERLMQAARKQAYTAASVTDSELKNQPNVKEIPATEQADSFAIEDLIRDVKNRKGVSVDGKIPH